MNQKSILLTSLLFITLCMNSIAQQHLVAFIDVNIIPMDADRILEHQTVLIEGNKIIKIGPFKTTKIPSKTQRIHGGEKFLIPGLFDMHVHISEGDLPLYIAQGVTTVRNLNGNAAHLELKDKINKGTLTGPRIFTSGPLITGPATIWKIKAVPTSVDNVRDIVKEQKNQGYDFIKVYEGLSQEMYDAIMEEAKLVNIPVAVHFPQGLALENILDKRPASIEHAEKFAYTSYFGFKFGNEKIPKAVAMTKNSGTWMCPTLASQEIFDLNRKGEFISILKNPEMEYVDSGTMGWWKSIVTPKKEGPINEHQKQMANFYPFLLTLTKSMFDAGVPILAGTDSPNPGMVHGYSIHEELRNIVAAGISPYQALKIATVNGAIFLKMESQIGSIKEGMIADLVLLEQNPLEEITNTKLQTGVMVSGKWYSKQQLTSMIEKIKHD